MADNFGAPWDNAYVAQEPPYGGAVGFTEPASQQSAPVPSAAQSAPSEAGSGPSYDLSGDEFEPGLSIQLIDQTPYEPAGVGPDIPWNAPPWKTQEAHGQDHGASRFFNSDIRPDTGVMQTSDRQVGSQSRGIYTDNLGRIVLNDIGRPEHDIYQTVQHDMSPRWIGYEERVQFGNIAHPAPYIQAADPSAYVPDGSYPDLSRQQSFAAEMYVSPPDPAQTTTQPAPSYIEPDGSFE